MLQIGKFDKYTTTFGIAPRGMPHEPIRDLTAIPA